MQFIDRKAKYPGRWTMKKSDGTSEVVTLIRNDEPTVEGTPLNAENLNEAISVDPTLSLSGKAADASKVGEIKKDLSTVVSAHKNYSYGIGTMPVTYSKTSSMWAVPYTNSNNKKFTIKIGIERINEYKGRVSIRLQARKAQGVNIAQIDSFIPQNSEQNDITLYYDFNDADFLDIKDLNVSAVFVDSGSITVKYFGLFEDKLSDCSTYTDNADKMYIYRSYSKIEADTYINSKIRERKKQTTPLFNLFGDYDNRDVKIVMVGDSTTDGVKGAAAGLYATLKLYQCSGELLEGATIIDMGANGATASAYISGYDNKTGFLYNAVSKNGDLYIVSFGLNDIRDRDITSQKIADKLSIIVDSILNNTNGVVILRVPNPFREDYNAVSTMTAQECTNVIYEAYMLIKNKWAKDKVRMLDMQTLVFGKKALPVDSNVLMNDSTHPKGLQNPHWATRDQYGLNKVARVIAESIGKTPTMTDAEYRKIVFDGEENDFQNHPMILTYKTESYTLIKDELSFGGMGTNYLDIWSITSEEMSKILAKGDIVSLGNKSAFVFDGTISVGTSSSNTRLGGQTYPVICSRNEVATVRIYRVIN